MLKLMIGATLAAIFSTSLPSSLLASPKENTHRREATTSDFVATQEISNDRTQLSANTLIALADRNIPEAAEADSTEILLGLAVVGSVATAIALNAKNAKKAFSTSPIPEHYNSRLSLTNRGDIRIEQANRNLQKKLLRLLHDDRDTANRLLSQVKRNHPDRPVNWCVEKVIYDLERDRSR